jgi:hypothetical protein
MILHNQTGYIHPLYAASLAEFGIPHYLSGCGGWILERHIPDTSYLDAIGPYPLFFCEEWGNLVDDFELLKNQLVSISLVIGPFSQFPNEKYSQYFEIFRPYKDHYLLDLSLPLEETVSKGHRRSARRALRNLEVEMLISPEIDLNEWVQLYEDLIRRHQIQGIRAFSKSSFQKQLAIPNTIYFRVIHKGKVVGGNIFFLQDDVAYAHLSAFSDEGYKLGAPYAVKWCALQQLSQFVGWVNFGGSTRSSQENPTGLDYFKMGWSSQTGKSYFCGKILDEEKYTEMVNRRNALDTTWFPAYRLGEF